MRYQAKGRIIDYAVVDEVPKDIAGFSLHALPEKGPVKILKFSWKHFDPDYGAKVRVIFSGTEKVNIKFAGLLSGIDGNFRDITNEDTGELIMFPVLIAMLFVAGTVIIFPVADYFARKITHEGNKLSKFMNSVAAERIFKAPIAVALVIGAIRAMLIWPPTPPL